MMALDLAVATHRPEGIKRVARMVLAPMEGVRYVVSWQAHENAPIPDELMRSDIEIHRFDLMGQSLNRNNAIEHCKADIILHSDDDLIYTPERFRRVVSVFEENPDLDVATFQSKQGIGKSYPETMTKLDRELPKNYSVGAVEIAFRRSTAGELRCCPEFGLGSPRLHGGEDEMFLMSAIRRGLDCRFFPITICEHPGVSTGTKAHFSDENLQASGCVISMTYPSTAILRIPLKAWRVYRAGRASLPRALYCLSRGALMAPGILKRNHNYLW